jgi:hypothetical protein
LRNRWMHEESLAQWFDSLEKLQGQRDPGFARNDGTESANRVYTLTIYNLCCR